MRFRVSPTQPEREKDATQTAIHNRKHFGPLYKEGQKFLHYHPAIAVGTTSKFRSSCKGTYNIEKFLTDVTFRIKEQKSTKNQNLGFDRCEPFLNFCQRPMCLEETNH